MRSRRVEGPPVTLLSFQDIVTSVMGIMILILLVIALELASRQLQSPAVQQATVREDVREALKLAEERLTHVKQALASGGWDDLASISPSEIEERTAQLEGLLPRLDQDLANARRRVDQLQLRQHDAQRALDDRHDDIQALGRLKEELTTLEEEQSHLASSNALFFRRSESEGKVAWLVQISDKEILAAPLGPVSRPVLFAGSTADSRRRQFLAWTAGRDAAREYFVLLIKPGGAKLYVDILTTLKERRFDVGLDLLGREQMAIDPERGAPVREQGKEGS